MQYILSEEEYKKLTPIEGITKLVDDFLKDIQKAMEPCEYFPGDRRFAINGESFRKAYQTLQDRMEYKLKTLTLKEND